MTDASMQRRSRWHGRLIVPALLLATVGCGGGVDVTPEAIARSRQLWKQADIRDYQLDWSIRGPNNAHYLVTVRGGEVRALEMFQRDGSKVELHSPKPDTFGVDGLFRTLDEELANVKSARPFGQPEGTRVVMRFQPDDKLGYPRWYHRDVLGTTLSIAIDVNALTPVPAGTKPRGP
jgi:hypothetical protein